ncbi:surface-adhesin E family protein [Novosphingobium lentum]|uniref:surface-adhesin E family protein n=1 Tax=Novosphingobium lentum TaxID=145287 RepID=UPI00082CEE31|nr:surface-adhesin E family protein [Novosphingobium lentum]
MTMLVVVTQAAALALVPIAETPGHSRFSYDPASVSVDGDVRSALIVTHNPDRGRPLPGDQVSARSTMEFHCADHAYRQVSTVAIHRDGHAIEVVPPNAARPFAPARPGSFERKVVDAICGVNR